eukprot:1386983-Rhodomonas_salina.4
MMSHAVVPFVTGAGVVTMAVVEVAPGPCATAPGTDAKRRNRAAATLRTFPDCFLVFDQDGSIWESVASDTIARFCLALFLLRYAPARRE